MDTCVADCDRDCDVFYFIITTPSPRSLAGMCHLGVDILLNSS